MKIALDVDDVITEFPEFYSALTHSLMNSGHEIIILTDFDESFRNQRVKELESYDIKYTELVITANKEAYCEQNNIDYAIDDDSSYYPKAEKSNLNIVKIKN